MGIPGRSFRLPKSSMLVYVHRNNKESRTSTPTFTQLLRSVRQCCFTSTNTIYGLLGAGSPMSLIFSLASEDIKQREQVVQDVHLNIHTASEICSSVLLYVHKHYIRTIRGG